MVIHRSDIGRFFPDDPRLVPEARKLFNQLRESGDGTDLAAHLLDTDCQLGKLFCLKFEQAFWRRLDDHDLLQANSLHEWIEERAKRTIKSFVQRSCCTAYEDRSDDSFEGYLYRLADRNLNYACLSAHSRLKKSPAEMADLSYTLHQQADNGAIFPKEFHRALRLAVAVMKQMPEPLRMVMRRAIRGESVEQIAAAMRMSRRKVQSLLDEGTRRTLDAWDQDWFDPSSR